MIVEHFESAARHSLSVTLPAPAQTSPRDAGQPEVDARRLERDQLRLRHDLPARLPASRGTTSEALLRLLDRTPGSRVDDPDLTWRGAADRALVDEDLQLALWLSHELRYRGLAGVDEEWETDPTLVSLQHGWEEHLLSGLRSEVRRRFGSPTVPLAATEVVSSLEDLAGAELGPSLSSFMMREASSRQFAEFLVHRSIYHLKEADPHTWVIPRLSGRSRRP